MPDAKVGKRGGARKLKSEAVPIVTVNLRFSGAGVDSDTLILGSEAKIQFATG